MQNVTDFLTDELIIELEEYIFDNLSKVQLKEPITLSEKVVINEFSQDEYGINILGKIANSKYLFL